MKHIKWFNTFFSLIILVHINLLAYQEKEVMSKQEQLKLLEQIKNGRNCVRFTNREHRELTERKTYLGVLAEGKYLERWLPVFNGKKKNPDLGECRKILEECKKKPSFLIPMLDYFVDKSQFHKEINELYHQTLNKKDIEGFEKKRIKTWIFWNTDIYDLSKIDYKEFIKKGFGRFTGEGELVEGTLRNWKRFYPFLLRLIKDSNAELKALAYSCIYKGMIKNNTKASSIAAVRAKLIKIAEDKSKSGYCRDRAISVLLEEWSSWPKWKGWYKRIFTNVRKNLLVDKPVVYFPFRKLYASNPYEVIPFLIESTKSKDKSIRSHAVYHLCEIINEQYREQIYEYIYKLVWQKIDSGTLRKCFKAVLPFLFDESWVKPFNTSQRLWLVRNIKNIYFPSIIPALIKTKHKLRPDEFNYKSAIDDVLKEYDNKSKSELELFINGHLRGVNEKEYLIELINKGVFTIRHAVECLYSFSKYIIQENRFRQYQDYNTRPKVKIGWWLLNNIHLPEAFKKELNSQLREIFKSSEKKKEAILTLMGRNSDLLNQDIIIKWLANDKLSSNFISMMITSNMKLSGKNSAELKRIIDGKGFRAGVAALILNNQVEIERLLKSDDKDGILYLLYIADLVNIDLPYLKVAYLLNSNCEELVLAAENYLIKAGTERAKKAYMKYSKSDYPIIGSCLFFENRRVQYLKTFRKSKDIQESYLLFGGRADEDDKLFYIITVHHDDSITYSYGKENGVEYTRNLSAVEFEEFKAFIVKNGVDYLEECGNSAVCDGVNYQYFHFTPTGGYQVFMDNPHKQNGFDYDLIIELFEFYKKSGDFEVTHSYVKNCKGSKLLLTKNVHGFWNKGNDRRVLISEPYKIDEGSSNDATNWYEFKNGKICKNLPNPEIWNRPYRWLEKHSKLIDTLDVFEKLIFVGDTAYFISSSWEKDFKGIWRVKKGGIPELIVKGEYSKLSVSTKHRWIVAELKNRNDKFVRINVDTKEIDGIKLPEEGNGALEWFSEAHEKFLISVFKDQKGKYYLFDPVKKNFEVIKGDFSLLYIGKRERGFQKTDKKDEVWAFDNVKGKAVVGRYNLRSFTYKPEMKLHFPIWESSALWVDEPNKHVYVVVDGALLRFPFIKNIKQKNKREGNNVI